MGRRLRKKHEQEAIRQAEFLILGPRLTLAGCSRSESELHQATSARLYELLDGLLDQEFICREEYDMARMAEKTLLVEAVVRALKRYDAYHTAGRDHTVLNPQMHVDWTSDKAVADYKSERNRRRW